MRDAWIARLFDLAREDERIAIVSADIGNRMFDPFRQAWPERFVNVGIAEGNMTGIAAGLAMAGLKPFTYTIAAFNPGRCAEQIRLDVCLHRLPVVAVGVGGGLSYASLGPTHHSLEDIAWMRSLPNMTVLCPGDPLEVRAAVTAALAHDGPVYLRLGKKGEPCVHDAEPELRIGRALRLAEGKDAALLAVGTTLPVAMAAAARLAGVGIAAAVYSFHCVKPLDEDLLERLFDRDGAKVIAVLEEHVPAGGAWAAVAEWLAERGGRYAPLLRFGVPDAFLLEAGDQDWLRRRIGLTPEAVAERVRSALERTT